MKGRLPAKLHLLKASLILFRSRCAEVPPGQGATELATRHPERIESEEFRQRKVDYLFPRSRFGLVCFPLMLPQLRFAVLANVSGNMQTTPTRSVSEVFAARKFLPK